MSATPPARRWQPDAANLHHEPMAVTYLRELAGLSRRALASAINVAPSLITEIEKGTRNAGPERLAQIAEAVGCPVLLLRSKRPDQETAA